MSVSRIPKYSRQREKGRADRAYVRIGGRKIKLGLYGSPGSHAKYAKLLSDDDGPSRPLSEPTVSELIVAYLEFTETYYVKPDGTLTREYEHVREAVKGLVFGVRSCVRFSMEARS